MRVTVRRPIDNSGLWAFTVCVLLVALFLCWDIYRQTEAAELDERETNALIERLEVKR